MKRKRDARPVCGVALLLVTWNSLLPTTDGITALCPFVRAFVPSPPVRLWSRVTLPKGSNRPPSRGKLV